MLMCNRKQCSGGFPLKILLDESKEKASTLEPGTFNAEFIQHILSRLDWQALRKTANSLNLDVPLAYTDEDKGNLDFLQAVHRIILDFQVLEGKMVCETCKREYPITNGIPNMLLQDDEV